MCVNMHEERGGRKKGERQRQTDRRHTCHCRYVEVTGQLLWKSVLSFHSMRLRNQTLVIRLDSRLVGPMNQIAGPQFHIRIVIFFVHKLKVFLKICTNQIDILHFL